MEDSRQVTDGVKTIFVRPDESIPDGFQVGRHWDCTNPFAQSLVLEVADL